MFDKLLPWECADIAVNGQPIAENFQNWFDGSVVKDASGAPLVVYRGDKSEVDSYHRNGRRETGLFFCLEPERAKFYGEPKRFALHSENVLDLRNAYSLWRKDAEVKEIIETIFSDYFEDNHSPETGEPYELYDVISGIEEGYLWTMDGTGGFTMDAWRALQGMVQHSGYDGLIVCDDGEGVGKGVDVIVFGPEQVKSLDHNSGLFLKDSLSVSDKEQAQAMADALEAARTEVGSEVVSHGNFSGRILDVAGGVVVQRINRVDTVKHDVSKLSVAVKTGDVVDIGYQGGVGVVGGLGVEGKDRGR